MIWWALFKVSVTKYTKRCTMYCPKLHTIDAPLFVLGFTLFLVVEYLISCSIRSIYRELAQPVVVFWYEYFDHKFHTFMPDIGRADICWLTPGSRVETMMHGFEAALAKKSPFHCPASPDMDIYEPQACCWQHYPINQHNGVIANFYK